MLADIKITKSQIGNLADNLQVLLQQRNITESIVANDLNIPVMTVRRIASGETADPRISTLKLLADYFEVTIDYLIGTNSHPQQSNAPLFIPILDWQTAKNTKSIHKMNLKKWQNWHPLVLTDDQEISANAFALESKPSMQPRFPLGTLFIIDPNATLIDSDMILIKMKKTNDLSLRELIIDPPKWQLSPIISGSEVLFYDKKQHEILGVVMMTMLYRR